MTTTYKATGRDTFGCRKQLKADGFVFDAATKSWHGDQAAVDKFKARGFRVKVYFSEVVFKTAAEMGWD